MKKVIFILIISILPVSAFSQTMPSMQLDTTKYLYCELLTTTKEMSNKVTIVIDFGEAWPLIKDKRLRDEQTGKVKTFNTMIDALNYMAADGWRFVFCLKEQVPGAMTSRTLTQIFLEKKRN